jgi:hypothetical protein
MEWAHPKLPDGRDLVLWEHHGCHSFPARARLLPTYGYTGSYGGYGMARFVVIVT